MPNLQKPLGWLQRFLYNVEFGPVPFPTPTIEVGQDWPLEHTAVQQTYTTIVGTVNTTIYTPGNEKHGLLWELHVGIDAGVMTVGDTFLLAMTLQTGRTVNPTRTDGTVATQTMVPLIGSYYRIGASNTNHFSIAPMYVPPGATVIVSHVATVAALSHTVKGAVVERLRSYPLRLP